MLNWKSTKDDIEIMGKIATRYIDMAQQLNIKIDRMTLLMDIEACNNNGCPLKLNDLLEAQNSEFLHDISGIQNNINRQTGKLENCFRPRYTK